MAYRYWIAGIALAATIVLIDCATVECCPRLFGGGLFFRAGCTPMVVESVPSPKEPVKPMPKPQPMPPVKKDLPTNIKEIAELFKRGEIKEAQRLAALAAQDIEEISDLMHMYRPRNKGGLGWGTTPQGNPIRDGIEHGLRGMGRDGVAVPNYKDAEVAGYSTAAIAEITLARKPKFKESNDNNSWIKNAEELRKAGIQLARASAANDVKAIVTAARKAEAACNSCHIKFKER